MKRSSNSRVWKPARTRIAIWPSVAPLALQRLDLVADAARLLLAVPHAAHADLLALVRARSTASCRGGPRLWAISPEAAPRIWRGRAVVVLEPDDPGAGKVALEAQDVADLGAAPAIDRLVVVADAAEIAVLLRQQAQPEILRRRWCPGTRRPGCSGSAADRSAARPALRREDRQIVQQQIAEIAGVQRAQPLLIGAVELERAAIGEVALLAPPSPCRA